MDKNTKQVYSTLKIDDNQLQILTAEYYNTRFNVINTFVCPLDGIFDYKIADKELVIDTIRKAVDTISIKIGARLEKVVLVLPPFNFKRISLRVSVVPNGGIVKKSDIARALTNSLKTKVGDDLLVINTQIIKYTVNGIATRRLPENEVCEELIVDIDLLCADKDMTYAYVDAVSESGLEILDLSLSNYAIAKESILLNNSINQNIIMLDIGNNFTYLSLLSKGKIISNEIIYDGLISMINKVYEQIHIPINTISRLIKYNVDYKEYRRDDAIFAWNDEKGSYSITVSELSDLVKEPLDNYIEKIVTMCKPILEKGASFCLCGEGSNMSALIEKLKEETNCEIKTYYPDTIGVRNTNLCAVYGALYVYKDKVDINNLNVNCVNMSEYDKTLDKIDVDIEGESITSKIKNLFEMYKDREDI